MAERITYFDILRGLAICGVVAIHSSDVGLEFPDDSLNLHFTILWRQLLNFSIPLFLAISGYFLANKKITHYDEYVAFIKKQIPRVYIPCLFWSVAWLILATLAGSKPILQQLYKLVTFQSSETYYFIALIIQYYILLPILKRLANIKGLVVTLITSLAMTGIIFYIRYFTDMKLPLIVYAGIFSTWLVFFVFGLYLGSSATISLSNKLLIGLILVFYSISCIESYVLYALFNQVENAVTAVKASSFMYSFVLIAYLFKNIDFLKSRALKSVGEMSFGIYLIHMFVLMIVSRLLSLFFPSLKVVQPVYQFTLIGTVMLSCFLFISVGKGVLSNKQMKIMGFK